MSVLVVTHADDVVLAEEGKYELHEIIATWNVGLEVNGMLLNKEKAA